jgi:hypothetical protein
VAFLPVGAQSAPDRLLLQGVLWAKTRPVAMINGRAFEANEVGQVRVGSSSVTIRCLIIREAEVEVQLAGSADRQTLTLKTR